MTLIAAIFKQRLQLSRLLGSWLLKNVTLHVGNAHHILHAGTGGHQDRPSMLKVTVKVK
jgi:hypothetical protein